MLEPLKTQLAFSNERFKEPLAQSKQALRRIVEFIADPLRFSNPNVNTLGLVLMKIWGNPRIEFDVVKSTPSAFFAVGLNEGDQLIAIVGFPTDYPKQIMKSLPQQVGIAVHIASQVADYVAGALDNTRTEKETQRAIALMQIRARAHEVEALKTLQIMAQTEGVALDFFGAQANLLKDYPNGVKDIEFHTAIFDCPIHRWMNREDRILRKTVVPEKLWRPFHEIIIARGKYPSKLNNAQLKEFAIQADSIIENYQLLPEEKTFLFSKYNQLVDEWVEFRKTVM